MTLEYMFFQQLMIFQNLTSARFRLLTMKKQPLSLIHIYKCQSCGHVYTEEEYEYLDENPQEVYEWWAVTNWLGDKLKERGEVVIEGWGHWYWGRGNTGQGIALDLSLIHICCHRIHKPISKKCWATL